MTYILDGKVRNALYRNNIQAKIFCPFKTLIFTIEKNLKKIEIRVMETQKLVVLVV